MFGGEYPDVDNLNLYGGGHCYSDLYEDFSEAYHVYALEWEEDAFRCAFVRDTLHPYVLPPGVDTSAPIVMEGTPWAWQKRLLLLVLRASLLLVRNPTGFQSDFRLQMSSTR